MTRERCRVVGRGCGALLAALVCGFPGPAAAAAQNPLSSWTDAVEARFSSAQPVLDYTVRVDGADTTGFAVTLHVRSPVDTFDVAFVAHPEYDDRYWRYVTDLRADAPGGDAFVTRADSALWRVTAPGGDVTISYRLALPPASAFAGGVAGERAAYRPFVSGTGALVGGAPTFMYVVGATLAPAHVHLDIPAGWEVATGLEPTVDPRVFYAPSADVLVESPILLGRIRSWRFTVDGTPHRVAYWPRADALPFDAAAFVDGIRSVVRQAVALFGRTPYRDYTFLLQDGAYGSLEHPNSVTIGVPSATLSKDPTEPLEEIAHEFFHAWNLMRIHPAEYGDVTWRTPPRSSGLWWSEGATMYYANLLLRRAGLARESRIDHVAELMARYYSTSGNHLLSPERVSRAEYGLQADQLGDNTASTHLQGELLTTVLDLVIRDRTHGTRTIDDVMRAMLRDFSGARGFTSDDVAGEVGAVCGCDMTAFFGDHVHGGEALDFNRYLAVVGLTSDVAWTPSVDAHGSPRPDLRAWGWQRSTDSAPRLYVLDTTSVWERAGLHTGDPVISVNGAPTPDVAALGAAIRPLRIGDSVRVVVRRQKGFFRAAFVMTGYERAVVTIHDRTDATPEQVALRKAWLAGR
jgi:predicted metalloprotease with PDZ domain